MKKLRQRQNLTKGKSVLNHPYILAISLVGFFLSLVLNIGLYMGMIQSNVITGNSTAVVCFILLMVILLAKVPATSKGAAGKHLMN